MTGKAERPLHWSLQQRDWLTALGVYISEAVADKQSSHVEVAVRWRCCVEWRMQRLAQSTDDQSSGRAPAHAQPIARRPTDRHNVRLRSEHRINSWHTLWHSPLTNASA